LTFASYLFPIPFCLLPFAFCLLLLTYSLASKVASLLASSSGLVSYLRCSLPSDPCWLAPSDWLASSFGQQGTLLVGFASQHCCPKEEANQSEGRSKANQSLLRRKKLAKGS
jgi:hypothetical protein